MTEEFHLSKPPITEAVIDFRCNCPEGSRVEQLKNATQALSDTYYVKGAIFQAQFLMGAENDEAHAQSSASEIGVRLHSHDEKYVIQWTLQGCALSRLEPYETWENLFSEMRRIWSTYLTTVKPTQIHRTAVRYINNLRLPIGDRFEAYLVAPPRPANGLPPSISSFLQRLVILDSESPARGAITQMYDPQVSVTGCATLILDIDVFSEQKFNVAEEAVWHHLGQLRKFKNAIFRKSVSKQAQSTYL